MFKPTEIAKAHALSKFGMNLEDIARKLSISIEEAETLLNTTVDPKLIQEARINLMDKEFDEIMLCRALGITRPPEKRLPGVTLLRVSPIRIGGQDFLLGTDPDPQGNFFINSEPSPQQQEIPNKVKEAIEGPDEPE